LGGSMTGTKEVAADLKAMGFKLMNRAGNHLLDAGIEGLFETTRLMEDAGLVYAGVGRNLDEARAPRFVETPKGRIGLVGMYSETGGNQSRLAATYRVGLTGGRPGLNALNLTRAIAVSADHLALLKRIKDGVEDRPPDFLVELAHDAIDNGADAFVGHGPHVLRGIEIYKGKPIFYDLAEFFREWDWSCDCNLRPNGDVTQAENVVRGLEARGVV